MTSVLVTGAAGQDGSYLVEKLLEKKYEVYGLVRRSSTNRNENLHLLILNNPRFHLVYGDICDYGAMAQLVSTKFDYIYNLAAQSHVGHSFNAPLSTFNSCANAPINFLHSILKFSPATKYYQASTSEMFGNSCEPDGTQNENTPMRPCSPYAIAKHAAHLAVKMYREMGIFACSGILFNHDSPRRGKDFLTAKVINHLSYTPQEKLKLGNMKARRDIGFSPEYVDCMIRMMEYHIPDDYVVATGNTWSVEEFVEEAYITAKVYGCIEPNKTYKDYVEIDPSLFRPCEVHNLRGNSEKARKVLGWSPKVITTEKLVWEMFNGD